MREPRVGGDRFGEPGLDRVAIGEFDREAGEGGDGLDDVERVTELGAGPGAGERTVAEPSTGARGEAEGERSTAPGCGRQDGPFDPAGAIEGRQMFLGRLATVVDEGHELAGGRDIGPIEDPQGRSITAAEEPDIVDHPAIGSRSRPERPDHGMGSRGSGCAITLADRGTDPVRKTRPGD